MVFRNRAAGFLLERGSLGICFFLVFEAVPGCVFNAFTKETSASPEALQLLSEAADDDVTIPLDLTKVMYTNLGPRATRGLRLRSVAFRVLSFGDLGAELRARLPRKPPMSMSGSLDANPLGS